MKTFVTPLAIVSSVLSILLMCLSVSWASKAAPQLQNCFDDKIGVRFLCNPDWELVESDDAILLVLSEDPVVTITISKTKTPLKFLEQLDRDRMAQIGGYREGFRMEVVQLAKEKALEVKAISALSPQARLLDYYVLHEPYLYGLLFSVDPQKDWGRYQALFREIADSFQIEPVDQAPSGQGPLKYFYGD